MASALVANYGGSSSEEESEDEANATEETGTAKESSGVNLLTSTNADSDSEDSDTDKLTSRISLPKSEDKSDKIVSKLPLPSFMTQDLSTLSSVANATNSSGTKSLPSSSVFANPFEKAEQQKLSILEQHVKLSSAEKTEAEMGKKICWMYRKGRCRFGHKCKFAHDNDIKLKQSSQEHDGEISPVAAVAGGMGGQPGGQHQFHPGHFVTERYGGHNTGRNTEGDEEDQLQSKKRKKPGLAQGLVPPKKSMMAFQKQASQERPWTMKK